MTEHRPTALITGASRGLGRALTADLATDGWRVVVDARHGDELAAAVAGLPDVVSVPGDVADPVHRAELAETVDDLGGLDVLVLNASLLGPSPQPQLADYPLDVLERVLRVNVLAPLGLVQALRGLLRPGARILAITSDAGAEPMDGWGGYGTSKAALEFLGSVLAVENPQWRVLVVDPGDMRTVMHQEAFPDEDISDRPEPETVVPALRVLVDGDHPSGRYRAADLTPAVTS
ncbi:short-chain dehydrogenase [Actinomycetospora sp. NBRC 106375]|uniref:SDR family NAD(P)-dependent oxidoreductase n=1 Tax=Actinomycetospora sp. NBRC 106375 TaxID=3032207 RepID=UPI0024A2F82B|nr:SDR family oxidoreductase [Actinomycetospora sp. NBRC 106375]GLZ45911.1 short-chain dehydrogenase [Actinomycetospora sp. NBRC 106375]